MHPELSFEEHRTARLVADALVEMGISMESGVGGTGVVGHLGEGRPAVGIRADMDALPIHEVNDVAYASRIPGAMHACGHDAHVAMVLGVGALLAGLDDRPPGEIRLLFQPSEEVRDAEGKSGAPRMIDDGALNDLDAVLALHVDPGAPSGSLGMRGGVVMAAVDPFRATLMGAGSHSALPHEGISPIAMLGQVINAVQNIRPQRIDPLKPAIIALESVRGGAASGVIPERVELSGTMRSLDEEVREQLHHELERALSVVRASGGDYELTIESYSSTTSNDPAVAQLVREVAKDIIGPEMVFEPQPRMYGEDFSAMVDRVPGAMGFLGVRTRDKLRPLHTPSFDLDESALPVGVAVLAESAVRLLRALTAGD